MEEGRNGGEVVSLICVDVVMGCGGGGENVCGEISVSYRSIRSSEVGCSHGGARMFARF